MIDADSTYLYLALGLAILWGLLGLWYFRSGQTAQARWEGQWWAYLLVWPWLLGRSHDDPYRGGRNFTWREFLLAALLILFMVGAVIFERFFPVSSRAISP